MTALLKKLQRRQSALVDNTACEQQVFNDAVGENVAEVDILPEIHYTNTDSTLVMRISLPSLDIDTALTFEVGLGGSLKKVKEYVDFMLDAFTTELAEEVGEECPGVNETRFRKFVEEAESKMDEWQIRLKKADESVYRAERLKAELVRMREAYHKDLMSLRQQLANAAKKENENGFDLNVVMHFDPRTFMHEEEQLIADLQSQLKTQEKSMSRMIKNLEADIDAMGDRLATKDLLADRQALLIETMQKEQGDMNEQMALQLQEAMSLKEAEHSARIADLRAEAVSKQICTRCRGRIEDSLHAPPPAAVEAGSLAMPPAPAATEAGSWAIPPDSSTDRHSTRKSNLLDPTKSSARRNANGEESRQDSKGCARTNANGEESRQNSKGSMRHRPSWQNSELVELDSPREKSDGFERPSSQAENRSREPQAPPARKNLRRKGLLEVFGAQDMQEALAFSDNVAVTMPPGDRSFKRVLTKSTASSMVQTELCLELLNKAQKMLLNEGGECNVRSRRLSAPAASPQVSERPSPKSNNSGVAPKSADDFEGSQKTPSKVELDTEAAFADNAQSEATGQIDASKAVSDPPPELTEPPPTAHESNGNGPAEHEATKPLGASRTENDLPQLTEAQPFPRLGTDPQIAPRLDSGGPARHLRRPAPLVLAQKTDKLQSVWKLQSDQSVNAAENSANMRVLPAFRAGNKKSSARQGSVSPTQTQKFSIASSRQNSPEADARCPDYSAPSPSSSFGPSRSTASPIQRDAAKMSNAKLRALALQRQYIYQQQDDDDAASVNENLLSDSEQEGPVYPSSSFSSGMNLPTIRKGEDIRPPVSSRSARGDGIHRGVAEDTRPPVSSRSLQSPANGLIVSSYRGVGEEIRVPVSSRSLQSPANGDIAGNYRGVAEDTRPPVSSRSLQSPANGNIVGSYRGVGEEIRVPVSSRSLQSPANGDIAGNYRGVGEDIRPPVSSRSFQSPAKGDIIARLRKLQNAERSRGA